MVPSERSLMVALAAGITALALGGCVQNVATGHPNPPPPAGYVVLCTTYGPFLSQHHADCRAVIRPAARTVVRAKG